MKHIKKKSILALCLALITPRLAAQNVTIHKQGGVGHAYEVEQVDSVVYFPVGNAESFPAPGEEGENNEVLWNIIKKQPNLKKFAAILETADYYGSATASAESSGLKLFQLLDGSMPLNVYAPEDAAITEARYSELLYLARTDGWRLQQEFAFNHISPQEGSTAANGNIVMLNGKIIDTGACLVTPVGEDAANGRLFIVSSTIPYVPNMKEYLRWLAPDCTLAQTFMADQEKEDSGTDGKLLAVPIKDGSKSSLYSIIPTCDLLAQQYQSNNIAMQIKGFGADLTDEHASFCMVTPTDAVWNDAHAKLSKHYQYALQYDDKENGNMGSTGRIRVDNLDSLSALSIKTDILVSLFGRTTDDKQTVLSNGTAYAASQWPVSAAEYKPDVCVETDGDEVFYQSRMETSAKFRAQKDHHVDFPNFRLKEITDIYGEISNNKFYHLEAVSTGAPTADVILQGNDATALVPDAQVMSGEYEVQLVMVPKWYKEIAGGIPNQYYEKDTILFDSDGIAVNYAHDKDGNIIYDEKGKPVIINPSIFLKDKTPGPNPDTEPGGEESEDEYQMVRITSSRINQQYIKELAAKNKNKIRATINYNGGSSATDKYNRFTTVEYSGEKVDTITVGTFNFPVSYKNMRCSYPTLTITSDLKSADTKNGYIRDFCIDKVILKSKEDSSETLLMP